MLYFDETNLTKLHDKIRRNRIQLIDDQL